MRFVNTKRFSPVIYERDLPSRGDFFHLSISSIDKDFLEKGDYIVDDEWWHKQRERCLNGYTVENAIEPGGDFLIDGIDAIWHGDDCYIPTYDLLIKNRSVHISGRMYFFLNFWKMYGLKEGYRSKTMVHPKFLAHAFFFFHRIEMMMDQEKDEEELKGRQLGFSEMGAGGVMGWNYTFVDDSLSIIVAGQYADSEHTMEACDRGLDMLINTQFYKKRERGGDSKYHIKSEKTGSEIWCLSARDDPQTLSRFSPYWVWYEEIGKGKKSWSINVAEYVKPSIFTEGRKTGWQHFIGTAGEMDEGIFDMEERYYSPSEYNILSFNNVFEKDRMDFSTKVGHFTGKDWYYFIDADGNPLREKSREQILKNRANATTKTRYRVITQEPIYASEAFMSTKVGYFGEHIIQLLNKQKQLIKINPTLQITQTGILEWINPDDPFEGVRWVDDPDGWLTIQEKPEWIRNSEMGKSAKECDKLINLYVAGIDSYDQDEAESSPSKGSMTVRKKYYPQSDSPHYNTYVAHVEERPTPEEGGAEMFYMHTVMVAIWYWILGGVNIEFGNPRIFDYYMNNGFENLLKPRPRLAFAGMIKNSVVSNRYGTDRSLKPQALAIARDRFDEEFISRMYIVRIIDRLSKFIYDPSGKKYNCDVTISVAEAEVAAKEDEEVVVKKNEEDTKETRGYSVFVQMADGTLMRKVV